MRGSFLAELYRRNPLLALVGWLHVVALLATFLGYATDDRIVMGVNTWTKPMKFMGSIALYLWTIAWFTRYVRRPRWAMKTVSIVIAVSIVIQSACILMQAARGRPSHFNVGTDFDAAVYQTIVIMLGINLLMVIMVLFLFSRPILRLPRVYLWGIRTGLVLFLIGGAIGGVMMVRGAHTVGAPDGGPGLPFLNWSTVAGDLRIAHGFALYALQILPLVGYALSRCRRVQDGRARLLLLGAAAAGYGALVYALFRQAMEGSPLFTNALVPLLEQSRLI
ncbi:MAG TPA: hypothetical protein VE175_14180 [Woeseiaceae bacterium]|jgi:hypothetical protein|nr:hypothetical protein [Woeseiaceae bacterium]